jgi:hypothetical protein
MASGFDAKVGDLKNGKMHFKSQTHQLHRKVCKMPSPK